MGLIGNPVKSGSGPAAVNLLLRRLPSVPLDKISGKAGVGGVSRKTYLKSISVLPQVNGAFTVGV